jgi:hypothetical protein
VNIERLRGRAKECLPGWAQDLARRAIAAKRSWLPHARFSFSTAREAPPREPLRIPDIKG